MADQLQEMLNKIYEEGVNKAKTEAENIIATAQAEADKVLTNARKEADKILSDANAKAIETERNLNSDLKMAAQQAMSALKNKVINAILIETIDKQTSQSVNDVSFLQKLILEVLSKWTPESSVVLTIPESKKAELTNFFAQDVKNTFKGNIKIDYSPLMKNGLAISPADGTYKLSFTDEDFANFFKSYLRPKAAQILFGE